MTMLKVGRRRRLAALLLVLLSSSATHPVQAGNNAGQSISFTIRCLGLAFSNPDQHVEVCNPVFHPTQAQESTTGRATTPPPVIPPPVTPPVVIPPPPPPPPPEEEDDDDGCPDGMFQSDCGGCYYPA